MKGLRVVIVNYRTPGLTIDCLRSLESEVSAEEDCRVVVVENHSQDDSAERIRAAIETEGWGEWAELLTLDRNLGFAGGNNAALRPILSAANPPAYVLLLNPDTLVRPKAINSLTEFMDRHPKVGIAGSRLEDPDGTPQESAFCFHTVLSELNEGMRLGIVTKLLRRWALVLPISDESHLADWVAGASMIIRKEVFDAVGELDENYFMYFEEVDFCLRANRAGWPCWYVPASRVVHLVGQASGVTDTKHPPKRLPRYWFESRRRYFTKSYGWLYTLTADLTFFAGFALWRLRRRLQRKPDNDPPHMLWDFLRYNLLPSFSSSGSKREIRMDTERSATNELPPLPKGDRNGNPADISFLALLKEDLRQHDGDLFDQGFWAVAVHRFGNWRMGFRSKLLRAPLSLLFSILFKVVEWTCGITLPYTTSLGRRVRIWHHSGMILHARSIGNDVHIRHNTTFGVVRRDHNREIPTIEDRVDIGCGVSVLGYVRIGHDSLIGAHSVVLKDVPPYSVAAGSPAKVLKKLRLEPDQETQEGDGQPLEEPRDPSSLAQTGS